MSIDLTAREAGFDALYESDPDPWGFRTSAYERAKYDATLLALAGRRFDHALEVGCSIGVLSQRLAGVCDRLTALDVSSVALAAARARAPGVAFVHAEVPGGWPAGAYDLVVFSEVLYFLRPHEVRAVAGLARRDLLAGGTVVLVNWRGECDMALDGEAAADLFVETFGGPVRTTRTDGYRLDVLGAPSL